MVHIEKLYFDLEEIAERWRVRIPDLAYMAENGDLRVSVRLYTVRLEEGVYEFDTRDGQLEETRIVRNLRRIGATVLEVDPETGRQWRVEAHGGHFGGSLDGVALGLPEAPKTWHVLEFKTHSAKSFRELVAKGVANAKPQHWAQMQIYMQLSVFTLAVDALFADPNLAREATYEPGDGDPIPVRVIARRADALSDFGDARLWSATPRFDLRVSEVASPRPGDRLVLGAETFVVQGEPVRDRERLVWTLDTRPV